MTKLLGCNCPNLQQGEVPVRHSSNHSVYPVKKKHHSDSRSCVVWEGIISILFGNFIIKFCNMFNHGAILYHFFLLKAKALHQKKDDTST